jgi:glycosyltransferase involved in cell wall biosynthesis
MSNILLLIPNLGFGGAQRCFSKLTEELAKKNKVIVCAFNNDEEIYYPIGGELKFLDVSGGTSLISKVLAFYKRVSTLKKIKRDNKIDISISYLEGANYINILTKGREKVIISIRGSQLHDQTITGLIGKIRKNLLIPFLYKYADKLVALNEGIKTELVEAFSIDKNKCFVIPNFYNVNQIKESAIEPLEAEFDEIFKTQKVIVTAGRLAIEKGYNYLIDVFSNVVKKKVGVKLVLIGDGPVKDELMNLAKANGLNVYSSWGKTRPTVEYDVFFIGYKKNPFKYIAKSTLFTITSSSEGGPNILSEAMICNAFCVSVDCPTGPREKIAPNTTYLGGGTLVPEFGPNGVLMPMLNKSPNLQEVEIWTNFIVENLDNDQLMNRYRGQASGFMEQFSVEAVMSKWIKVVNE